MYKLLFLVAQLSQLFLVSCRLSSFLPVDSSSSSLTGHFAFAVPQNLVINIFMLFRNVDRQILKL